MLSPTKIWTLEELHSLPDDGNMYELIRGQLFVTPAPRSPHSNIVARLTHLLVPYVTREKLGYVFHPRSVLQYEGTQVEPDTVVRGMDEDRDSSDYTNVPTPSLVIEVASRTTRQRDRTYKRELYMEEGIPEYWIVDGAARTITVVRPMMRDSIVRDVMVWHPAHASEALTFDLVEVFGAV